MWRTSWSWRSGGGRYLFDTIKGEDLGAGPRAVVLDFNFACTPSCAYSADWICPLAPPENRLMVFVEAGARVFRASGDAAAPEE